MVNILGELNTVERTMNNYISNLKNLLCTSTSPGECQVDSLIKKVMRKENIDNGNPPSGGDYGTGRFGALQSVGPKYSSQSIDDNQNTTSLLPGSGSRASLNNNPEYRPNMIEVLNTPFDHIERIVLQDLSDTLFKDGENYFKGLFTFPASL